MNYAKLAKKIEKESEAEACGTCLAALAALAWMGLKPALIMWLWNWIAVSMFGAPYIGYWEALGLNLLTGLLFRG